MAEYVERGPISEIAIHALEIYKEAELQNIFEYSGQILKYSAELEKTVADRINDVRSIPAADVVSRDCYDSILEENDTMREMLAQIGKKPGDKMDDVMEVVRCKDCRFRNTVACLATVPATMKDNEYCCEGKRMAYNG